MYIVNHELVREAVPTVYNAVRGEHCPAFRFDMSHSNLCHYLTLGLGRVLENAGQPVRREMHEAKNGMWHFVIAHADVAASPSDNDIITDLNPWQHNVKGWNRKRRTAEVGYLHGPRVEVMERLEHAGAPEWHVGLRGLTTITAPHTMLLSPGLHWRPRRMNELSELLNRTSRPD